MVGKDGPPQQLRTVISLCDMIPPTSDAESAVYVVRLSSPGSAFSLPTYLELGEPPTPESICCELRHWGYDQHHVALVPTALASLPTAVVLPPTHSTSGTWLLFVEEPHDTLYWYHSEVCVEAMNETTLLRIIGDLGKRRAAILDVGVFHPTLCGVRFKDVSHHPDCEEPTSWFVTDIPTTGKTMPPRRFTDQIRSIEVIRSDCQLRPHCDLNAIKQFFNTSGFLRTDFGDIELPPQCIEALQDCGQASGPFDRLRIYVDGSSNPMYKHWEPGLVVREGKPDAWAFVVLGETFRADPDQGSDLTLIGYATQPVCYERELPYYSGAERIGSDVAEREALLWSGLWRLSYNVNTPTVFLSDSLIAGNFAFGNCGAISPDLGHTLTRGVFQALATLMPDNDLQLQHVSGHAGEIWNECCDTLAKWSSNHVHWYKRQDVDLRVWKHVIPSLWWYFETERQGLPPMDATGVFHPVAPRLPETDTQPALNLTDEKHRHKTMQVHMTLSLASANVQTLGRGPDGYAGKLDYIQQQFHELGLCVVGIQEARTDEIFVTKKGQYIRMASGSDHGHLGVELWISQQIPFGYADRQPCYFCSQDINVLHRDPRRLLVRITNRYIDALFLVLHGPQSGRDIVERETWWTQTGDIVGRFNQIAPLYVLGDMNATMGLADHVHIFRDDLQSPNTDFFRQFIFDYDLTIPASTDIHVGTTDTWTSPDGSITRSIDHILVPTHHLGCCTHSAVIEDVDLGSGPMDHQAVGLQLCWSFTTDIKIDGPKKKAPRRDGIKHDIKIRSHLQSLTIPKWDCDIESQVNQCNEGLLASLEVEKHSVDQPGPKKSFLQGEAWDLRRVKNHCKHKLSDIDSEIRWDIYRAAFLGWKQCSGQRDPELAIGWSTGFRHLLYCCKIKFGAKFTVTTKRLRDALRHAKGQHLERTINSIPETSSASQILTLMKPVIGSSNSRKRNRPCLPHVLDEDGQVCCSAEAARNRWIEFFAAMEGGSRIDAQEQRRLWIDNLRHFLADRFTLSLEDLPTLFDLECALRRVRQGKAVGEDGIPPELCGGHPVELARILYPQLVKLALHGQEALIHKGGRLAIAHKKGPTNECSSFRSLLVSSHVGKTLHRALRQHQQVFYTTYMQSQQVGGRPKIPVNFAVHMVRAHLRMHVSQGTSASLIFLDLTEAFCRVLRPLVLGGSWDDQVLAAMAAWLKLDAGTLHDLKLHLAEPDALTRAGVPDFHRKYLQALHADTHFHLPQQCDRVRTTFGSRPGDSFADVVFGFLWARVLHILEEEMANHELLTMLPKPARPSIYAEASGQLVPFLGPTWCDDLCICLSADDPAYLERSTGTTVGLVLDICREHGMTPNLKRGKTEVLFSFRGKSSRSLRRKYYGNNGTGVLVALGESTPSRVGVVGEYKHLGGLVHVTGDMRKELRRRLGIAHSTFGKFRRVLFHNLAFDQRKRANLFQTLVMSQLTYGMETWVLTDQKARYGFHAGVIRLYRRFLKLPHDGHYTDQDVLVRCGLPSPSTLLRRARLRYLGLLYRAGPQDIWSIVLQDSTWLTLVQDDVAWMWAQLSNSSPLSDPQVDFSHWEFIMTDHPRYWKRLVTRSVQHEALQREHAAIVHRQSEAIVRALQSYGTINPEIQVPGGLTHQADRDGTFGCLQCEQVFKSRAGEAVHMNRKHGVPSSLRYLFSGSSCPCCLREYHVPERVHQHLRKSRNCRRVLEHRGHLPVLAVGCGSRAHTEYEEAHNRLTPYQVSEGPLLPPPHLPPDAGGQEEQDIDEDLAQRISNCIDRYVNLPDELLLAEFRAEIRRYPVKWTTYSHTLAFLDKETKEMDDDTELLPASVCRYKTLRPLLQSKELWPFLDVGMDEGHALPNGCWEQYLQEVILHHGLPWKRRQSPRSFGKERYFLHFFSGRRRPGDIQFYLDQKSLEGFVIHTVSIDIVVDPVLGNLMQADAQAYWLKAINDGFVIALLGGPPCETWSMARGRAIEGRRGPRVLRTTDWPWGRPLGLRELHQLIFGTSLLLYMLEAFVLVTLGGGVALLEHPAEPDDPNLVTIWKLVLVVMIETLPGVARYRVRQGCMGSESAKPTDLLCANLHSVAKHLREHQLWQQPPQTTSIGLDSRGSFKTSRLKEYPPALNKAIAESFVEAISAIAVDPSLRVPEEFKARCSVLQCKDYGDTFGPDFAPG